MKPQYEIVLGDHGTQIKSVENGVSKEYWVPSLGSQNHQFLTQRDWEEVVHLMNYTYNKGLKDKAAAITAELY